MDTHGCSWSFRRDLSLYFIHARMHVLGSPPCTPMHPHVEMVMRMHMIMTVARYVSDATP